MDVTWKKLSAKEVEWDNGIAEDLNALEDETMDELPELDQLDEFYRRLNANEWLPDLSDEDNRFFILSYLRKELKAHPEFVQIIRSIQVENYLALKLSEVALLISQATEEKWPEFQIFSIRALHQLGRNQEGMEKATCLLEVIGEDSPDFLNQACEILLDLGVQISSVSMETTLRNAIRNVRELRTLPEFSTAKEQEELSGLETSLTEKLGAVINPAASKDLGITTVANGFTPTKTTLSLAWKIETLKSAA